MEDNLPANVPKIDAAEKLIAIDSYKSRTGNDLDFQKGDIMDLLDNSNADWWFVRNAKGQKGFVPVNFVVPCKTPQAFEWFHGQIRRIIAEKLLAHADPGTFLIRNKESGQLEEYVLTIREQEGQQGPCVKHYKIQFDEAKGYSICKRAAFSSLEALVNYYSEQTDGLCHKLTDPAPRISPVRPDPISNETGQNWEIHRKELEMLRKLGEGNFGQVWHGKWRGKMDVAIKTVTPGTMSSDELLSEANAMKQCQHPNLVRLFAVCTIEEPFHIITEYMPNGSLLEYLKADKDKQEGGLSMQTMVDICAQIANGMKCLEEHKLVHRNLAARNVLMGEQISGVPVVKVADFGLRAQKDTTIKWTAPEAAAQGTFTAKSDVWSYGVLLFEIFTRGAIPYAGMEDDEVLEQVDRGFRLICPKINEPENQEMMNRIYDKVMLKCWDKDPDKRPTFKTLFYHFDDFFASQQLNE